MKKRLALPTVLILVSALSLAGCGSKKNNASSNGSSDALVQGSTASKTGAFGTAITLSDGITLTLSVPTTFTPGQFATNYVAGQTANIFDVTVKNSGSAVLDPATISLQVASGANNCVDVLDGDNGLNGAPTDPITSGSESTFKFGIACDAKSGDPLNIIVSVGSSIVAVDGKLS